MPDLKISQFADGGAILVTDEIATNRDGVNTKVFVGSAAALDAGTGINDVVQIVDVGGNPALPILDGSLLTGISLPSITASDVEYIPGSGSIIISTDVQGALDELDTEVQQKLENVTGLIAAGSNVSLGGSGTSVSPYIINATSSTATAAEDVTYDPLSGGNISSTNVQDALEEVDAFMGDVIITSWVAYTPTFTSLGTVSVSSVRSRRVGGSLEVMGKFTPGTPISTEARITLGFNGTSGGVTSLSTLPSSTTLVGYMIRGGATSSQQTVLIEPSVGYLTLGLQDGSNGGLSKQNGNQVALSGTELSFFASVPIQGW